VKAFLIAAVKSLVLLRKLETKVHLPVIAWISRTMQTHHTKEGKLNRNEMEMNIRKSKSQNSPCGNSRGEICQMKKNGIISAFLLLFSDIKTSISMPCYILSLTPSNGVYCGEEMFVLPPYFHFLNISMKVGVKILWNIQRTKLFLTFLLKKNISDVQNTKRVEM
jgi:hypothetical protein